MHIVIARFGGFEIPDIYEYAERLIDIAQTRRIAGGVERRDAIAVKRAWDIATRPIPIEQVQEIELFLNTIMWGYSTWWVDEFGDESNTVIARIDAESWIKGRILGLNEYRTMSFTVIER